MNSDLKLIVFPNAMELGEKINKHLQDLRGTRDNYIIPISPNRFANGEGKVRINETVRGKDLYILSDVGNYNISYQLHGKEHFMAPDEHLQDIKRAISATSGHANKINLIMPLLYESRQHKRKGRESLDCAIALQELEQIGVNNIITFDAHDPNVVNAVPKLSFDNFYPTDTILESLIKNEKINNPIVISPDMGAIERARYYAEVLGCDVGMFYKRRDLSKVIDGKNPILEHVYLGGNVMGKDILIVDDMIASGSSMIEVAIELKKKGASSIYLISTFSLFTNGISTFDKAYQDGNFTKLYTTNLSYIPEEIKTKEWFCEVDSSLKIAKIIDKLNKNESIEVFFDKKITI